MGKTIGIHRSKTDLQKFLAGVGQEEEVQARLKTMRFDLEKKHLLYGRIDRDGDPIFIIKENLEQIDSGTSTEYAADFVADAFTEFQANFQMKTYLEKDSAYSKFFSAKKAFRFGDQSFSYAKHMERLYTNFVQDYLQINRRYEKIHNFNDFNREFMKYACRIARYFPITRTGYILSNHCSPYTSGLMIDIAAERHGVAMNKKILDYVNDPNFNHFVKAARNFGFMVDKNSPWRIVFNVASAGEYFRTDSITGLQTDEKLFSGGGKYLANYGLEFNTVFDVYYEKAHLREVESLRERMFVLYDLFYKQYGTYVKLRYHKSSFDGACVSETVTREYKDRKPLPEPGDAMSPGEAMAYGDEYWIKIILKLRILESDMHADEGRFLFLLDSVVDQKRTLGTRAALNYINNLTKGLAITKFVREGDYWYGQNKNQYEYRRQKALEDASSFDQSDFELNSSLNKVRG